MNGIKKAHIVNARRALMTKKEVNIATCLGDVDLGDAPAPEKTCSGCKQSLPPQAFGVATKRHDGLQPRCRKCRGSYKANTRRIHDNNASYAQRNLQWLAERFAHHKCAHCGDAALAGDMRLAQLVRTKNSFRLKVNAGWSIAALEAECGHMAAVHSHCFDGFVSSLPERKCFGHMALPEPR